MNKLKSETLKFKWETTINLTEREIVRYKRVAEYFNQSGKLLDVGCRHGLFRNFLNKDIQYYGVDFIEEYKKFVPNFIYCDIAKNPLPIEDSFFDFIYLGEILEHISNFFFVFEEMYRVLKKNGLLVLTVPNNFNLAQAIGIIRYRRYKRKNLDISKIVNSDTHIHSFYEPDLLKISQMIGFKPYDCDRFYNFFGKFKLPEWVIFKPFAKFLLYAVKK